MLPLPKVTEVKGEANHKRVEGSGRNVQEGQNHERPGTPGRQATTEIPKQKKKPGTPTPYSQEEDGRKGRTIHTAKQGRKSHKKKMPLHQQPRQHSIAGNARCDTVRSSTPLAGTPKVQGRSGDQSGNKVSNPGPTKVAVFYTNLMKAREDGRFATREEGKGRGEVRVLPTKVLKIPQPGMIPSGSSFFTGLEQAAQKKLNKHSSSLDNTDWMACYERARKGLSAASPKDAPPNRAAANGTRPTPNNVVLISGCRLPRPLLTPTSGSRPIPEGSSNIPKGTGTGTGTAGIAGSKSSWVELKQGDAEAKAMRSSGSQKFLQKVMQRQGLRANPLVVSLLRKQHREVPRGQDQAANISPKLSD